VLSGVELHLEPGWYGLIGPNGAGKTTLLKLLAGELEPDSGSLRLQPSHGTALLCPQRVQFLDPSIEAFSRATDGAARRISGELELEASGLLRWESLSAGERKRWQIGAALHEEPDVLLLDEPTNHLDGAARRLLLASLARFRGVGVLVSHDRELLDALTTSTIRVLGDGIRVYSGPYAQARASWEHEQRERERSRAKLRNEERRLRSRLQERRERRERSQQAQRTSRRMKNAGDSDARLRYKTTRRRSAEASAARDVRVVGRRLTRVSDDLEASGLERELGSSIFVGYELSPNPVVMELREQQLCVAGRVLLEDLDLQVQRSSRIRISGPNGSGKTTLMRALIKHSRVSDTRLLYLPQDLDREYEAKLLERVRALPQTERGRTLSIVAALGVEPERVLASRELSPGEARKLLLALGLGERAWALLLDEPTNHLDLPSVERLETALQGYPGALILVTHDEQFARSCSSDEWALESGRVIVRDVR